MSELLLPNPEDVREMAVFDTVPEHDQQAWLHFLHDSHKKESIGIGPEYTFNQFDNGVAPHTAGLIGFVDQIAEEGFDERPLVPNYREAIEIEQNDRSSISIEPLLTAFGGTKDAFEKARKKGPIAIELPHSSLASPFAMVRSLLETHGQEIADKIYIVIGPRPAVIKFETYSKKDKEVKSISPVDFGRALGNVLLTGPNTDSTRLDNPELVKWLRGLRRTFYERYQEIIEPKADGDNNIVVFCSAGRVAEELPTGRLQEFRTDGSFKYLMNKQLQIWPVGVYDRLLRSPEHPESIVYVNPDKSIWPAPRNENEAQWYHERSVFLSNCPVGGIDMESVASQGLRMAKQKIRKYASKIAERPRHQHF